MTTRLLLHDALTTANIIQPLRLGWVQHEFDVDLSEKLESGDVDAGSFALIPSPEITLLVDSHNILAAVAVVDEQSSAIAMRTPVRPDDIEASDVVLYETNATAEVLARALLWPFFGITARSLSALPNAEAQVTIVEGALALQEPETGQSLDLGRSWFVMTGMPLVSHVLIGPRNASSAEQSAVVSALNESLSEAHARRRELRQRFDTQYSVDRERLVSYFAGQRYRLDAGDREALVALLVRGAGGSRFRPLTRLPYADDDAAEEDATS
ncbi:MAG: MqnA/MqnD/SBP family protein [Thermomicrobiales bacterium]